MDDYDDDNDSCRLFLQRALMVLILLLLLGLLRRLGLLRLLLLLLLNFEANLLFETSLTPRFTNDGDFFGTLFGQVGDIVECFELAVIAPHSPRLGVFYVGFIIIFSPRKGDLVHGTLGITDNGVTIFFHVKGVGSGLATSQQDLLAGVNVAKVASKEFATGRFVTELMLLVLLLLGVVGGNGGGSMREEC